jgi:hypothetical protein
MAVDAGLISAEEEAISMGGKGGADTAARESNYRIPD